VDALRRCVARRLESGTFRGPLVRAASALWECAANPVRPLRIPGGTFVVGIGGATLGGSGKTPTVLALGKLLARCGSAPRSPGVVVVASGYGVRGGPARVVQGNDPVRAVGDEALMLARGLGPEGIPVVVAGDRQRALGLAASLGRVVLVDSLLQAWPRRVGCSVLVLDADAPWGSGRCPPAGDLRASPDRLLAAADAVLLVRDARTQDGAERIARGFSGPVLRATGELRGATAPDGRWLSNAELRASTLGLLLAVGRPDRIIRSLARRGIAPARTVILSDHATPSRVALARSAFAIGPGPRLDAWVTTSKCATKLGQCFGGAPVWTLRHALTLPAAFADLCSVR